MPGASMLGVAASTMKVVVVWFGDSAVRYFACDNGVWAF